MRTAAALVVLLFSLPARAQQPGVGASLSVTPLQLPAGVEAPGDPHYLYQVTLALDTFLGVEVIADRRLLWLEVHENAAPPRARALRCADPTAPRFARSGMRNRMLGPAGGPAATRDEEHPVAWTEWIDLREYCSGRALAALDRGARVVPHYGFAHGPRDAWVARTTELTGEDARHVKELVGPELEVAPHATSERTVAPLVTAGASASSGEGRVTLAAADADRQASLRLRVALRTAGPARRVYLLTDQIHFRVRSALGTVECGLPHETHGVVADFFRRIGGRRAATLTLEANIVCHDAFPLSGIYEVTPLVSLPYRAPAPHDTDSLTGDVTGAPAVVRIRRGDRGYVEQLVEDLARTPAPPAAAHGDRS